MAATLVTFAEAKYQLGIPLTDVADADREALIQLKLDDAEGLIVQRCSATAYWAAITPTWTPATVPAGVRQAILVLLAHLYEHRGDDDMTIDAALWAAIDHLIGLNKDPVIA